MPIASKAMTPKTMPTTFGSEGDGSLISCSGVELFVFVFVVSVAGVVDESTRDEKVDDDSIDLKTVDAVLNEALADEVDTTIAAVAADVVDGDVPTLVGLTH